MLKVMEGVGMTGSGNPPEAVAFLHKAQESIADAQAALRDGRHNSSVSRSYYGAFQAAVAALWAAGVRPVRVTEGTLSHSAVQAEWAGRLIYRRKLYPSELRRVLPRLLELRVTADYRTRDATAREAHTAATMETDLLRQVEARLARWRDDTEDGNGHHA
jgi:uncharacterized protein (UPF0332 family)